MSWICSTQLFLLLAMGLPPGVLLYRGHFRVTLVVGSLFYVLPYTPSLPFIPLA